MSLDKAIQHGKEYRKPYRQSQSWDRSCRNHGTCGYCHGNRTHANHRRAYSAREESLAWESEHNALFDPWTWMDEIGPSLPQETDQGPSWSGLN